MQSDQADAHLAERAALETLREICRGSRPMNPAAAIERLRSDSSASLSEDSFRRLFALDTTFGSFGIPVPQQDPFLNVVALTAFQPYAYQDLIDNQEITAVLTPIYRVLCVLAVLEMRQAGFEGYDAVPLDRVLPYRPRTGFHMQRYVSLLDVACSLWTRVCHAYTRANAQSGQSRISSLHCFTPGQLRSHHVWIETDPSAGAADWVSVQSSTLDDCEESLTCILVDETRGQHWLVTFTGDGRVSERLSPSGDDLQTVNQVKGEGALVFVRTDQEPGVELVQGDADHSYFLLMTQPQGLFAGFYRNVCGQVDAYPLYLHESHGDNDHGDMVDIPLGPERCAACGRDATADHALIADEFEPLAENSTRRYCSPQCIVKMRRIDYDRRLVEERERRQRHADARIFPSAGARRDAEGVRRLWDLAQEEEDHSPH